MASFGETSDVDAALTRLRDRPDGPFVVQLAREPSRRDSRWAHLFSGPVQAAMPVADVAHAPAGPVGDREPEPAGPPEVVFPGARNDDRLTKLEHEVAALRLELDELKKRLGE